MHNFYIEIELQKNNSAGSIAPGRENQVCQSVCLSATIGGIGTEISPPGWTAMEFYTNIQKGSVLLWCPAKNSILVNAQILVKLISASALLCGLC